MNAAILKVLDISTGHLPEHVATSILEECGLPTCYQHPEGYGTLVVIPCFLHNDANGDPQEETAMRTALGDECVNILKWASDAHGCWGVNFDRDGEEYEEFPKFDW